MPCTTVNARWRRSSRAACRRSTCSRRRDWAGPTRSRASSPAIPRSPARGRPTASPRSTSPRSSAAGERPRRCSPPARIPTSARGTSSRSCRSTRRSRAAIATSSIALLDAGADPNVRQRHGWTPLQGAAQHGDAELVDRLLAAGADPGGRQRRGHDGRRPGPEGGSRGARGAARCRPRRDESGVVPMTVRATNRWSPEWPAARVRDSLTVSPAAAATPTRARREGRPLPRSDRPGGGGFVRRVADVRLGLRRGRHRRRR